MTIETIITFLANHFAGKALDNLLSKKEDVALSINQLYNEVLREYSYIQEIVDNDIKKYHFSGARITEEGVIKWFFDESYSLENLCNELRASPNIQTFSIEEVSRFLDRVKALAKQDRLLGTIIISKEIDAISDRIEMVVNPGLILSPDKFIEQYEHPSLRVATPLKNKFYGREKELSEGLAMLHKSNIVIITGSPGVGKTKLGIELCSRYTDSNKDYKFFCLSNFTTGDVYTAFHDQLKGDEKIIILVDDANRVCGNYLAILNHLPQVKDGRLKIIVTVRDYAYDLISNKSTEYNYSVLTIKAFEDEDISNILKSQDFNIQNQKYLSRINNISKGNARLAIMCALVALEKQSIDSLNNVQQLFDEYFGPIYKNIIESSGKDSLKVLGILSLFRVLNKENEEPNNTIYSVFDISKEQFWQECIELNHLELVDLYENEVVKISDQTLSTYLHYRVFFVDKVLSYQDVISNFIAYNNKITDSLIPIVNNFGVESIESEIIRCVDSVWDSLANHDDVMSIISPFWYLIPQKSILYLNRWIQTLPSVDSEYEFDYNENEISLRSGPKELELISDIGTKCFDYTEAALELMFMFVQKFPHHTPFLLKTLKANWNINRLSGDYGYCLQHALTDFLINCIAANPSDVLFSRTAIAIAETILSPAICDTECRGNTFTMYRGHVNLNPQLADFRRKYWTTLFSLSQKHPIEFRRLLLPGNLRYDGKTPEVFQFDMSLITEGINTYFSAESFIDCFVVHKILHGYGWMKFKFDQTIQTKFDCRLLVVYKLFNGEKRIRPHRDHVTGIRNGINEYCKRYSYEDYIGLLADLKEIREVLHKLKDGNNDYYEEYVLNAVCEKRNEIFIDILIHVLSTYPESTRPYCLLSYINSPDGNIDSLINRLSSEIETPYKIQWLLYLYANIPDKYVTPMTLNEIYTLLSNHSLSRIDLYILEQLVEKYSTVEAAKQIWNHIMSILEQKINTGESINIDSDFITNHFKYIQDTDKLFRVYIHCKKNLSNRFFDHDHEIIKFILSQKPQYITDYLENLYKDVYSRHGRDMTFIWQLDNHKDVADIILQHILVKKNKYKYDWFFYGELFGCNELERQVTYLKQLIEDRIADEKIIYLVFVAVSNSLGDYIYEFVDHLLSCTDDLNLFKNINLLPQTHSWSGSIIPIYQNELGKLQKIKQIALTKTPHLKFIEHVGYMDTLIRYKESDIKHWRKREFESED